MRTKVLRLVLAIGVTAAATASTAVGAVAVARPSLHHAVTIDDAVKSCGTCEFCQTVANGVEVCHTKTCTEPNCGGCSGETITNDDGDPIGARAICLKTATK